MKKSMNKILLCGLVTAITISSSSTALAGTWKQDHIGWWWQEDNGSYPVSTWQWIDGNNDSIAECYYFNEIGYMLANTITPDGYTVNTDGAWSVNGVVQTQYVSIEQEHSLSEKAGYKVGDTVSNSSGLTVIYQGNDLWTDMSTNTNYIATEDFGNGELWLERVIPRSEWTHIAEDYGYSIGDTMSTTHRGEHLTLEYLGNDRWQDQTGRIWKTYKHKDGTLHWSYFG